MEITIHKEKRAISHFTGNKKGRSRVTGHEIPFATLWKAMLFRLCFFIDLFFSITVCIYLCFSGKVLFQFLDFGFIFIRSGTKHGTFRTVFKGKLSVPDSSTWLLLACFHFSCGYNYNWHHLRNKIFGGISLVIT